MPLESTATLYLMIVSAAAGSLMAGAAAETASAEAAVATAHQVQQLTDDLILWYSLAGGLIGALVSLSFGFLPGTHKEGAVKTLGSALAAVIIAPAILFYFQFPQTLIPIVSIAGAVGMTAYIVLIRILPMLGNLAPEWLKALFKVRGINTDDYDMSGGRSRAARHDDTSKVPPLSSPPARKPRKPYMSDDGENVP